MDLPPVWLDVAAAVGVDAFLTMWRILDQHDTGADPNTLEVRLRRYRSYQRRQRNNYIRALAAAGRTPAEIADAVRTQLGETLGIPHIKRLINQS